MKRRLTEHLTILNTAAFWVLTVMLFGVIVGWGFRYEDMPIFQGKMAVQDKQWRFGEKSGDLIPVKLNEKQLFEPGKVYVLTTDFEYTGEGDAYPSAFIATGNMEVEVYYHGDRVFHHTKNDKLMKQVRSVGNTCFSVSLNKDCGGKNIRLELSTPLDHPSSMRLPAVFFGDHETQIRTLCLVSLPSILISAAITFAVIILVMLGNTVDGSQWTYVYFSIFALLVVSYRSTHDLFLVYIWANPFLTILLEYFSIVVCPIPLLMSFRNRMKNYYQGHFVVMIGISLLNFLVQSILHCTGICDVADMVLFTHLWLVVSSVWLVSLGLSVRRRTGEKLVVRYMVPTILGTLMDMGLYYIVKFVIDLKIYYPIGSCVGVGLLVSLIFMILDGRKSRVETFRKLERSRMLERMAYQDNLTGIGNRAAFTRDVSRIATGNLRGKKILVISADLNGLKRVNDTLGHMAGDSLICRAANILTKRLGTYGAVFRTGGDEFFALLTDVDENQWDSIREEVETAIREENETEDIPLSIAMGAAALEDGNITDAMKKADERMYVHKERQHRTIRNF